MSNCSERERRVTGSLKSLLLANKNDSVLFGDDISKNSELKN